MMMDKTVLFVGSLATCLTMFASGAALGETLSTVNDSTQATLTASTVSRVKNKTSRPRGPLKVVGPRVDSFWIIDALTKAKLLELKPGLAVDLAKLSTKEVAIQAQGSSDITRVVFALNGRETVRDINTPPFVFPSVAQTWLPSIGINDIAATAYRADQKGGTKSLRFRVFNSLEDHQSTETSQKPEVAHDSGLARARLIDKNTEENDSVKSPNNDEIQAYVDKILSRGNSHTAMGSEKNPQRKDSFRTSSDNPNRCVGILNKEVQRLTVVCSHTLLSAAKAEVVLDNNMSLCNFPDTSSPMITSCEMTEDLSDALTSGQIVVAVEDTKGQRTELAVHGQ